MTAGLERQFSLAYLTILGTPPTRMVEVAAETGYDFVSLRLKPVTPDEPHFPFLTDPTLAADVIKAMEEYSVPLLDVELIRTDPESDIDEFKPFIEVSAEMGARHVIVQVPLADRRLAIEGFQSLCDLAAPHEMTVDLEFIPWTPTVDLDAAVEIVTKANRPNGGVLVDTLHFYRSESSVTRLGELPGGLFNFVQLCDARAPVSHSEEEMIHIARADRQPPGQGVIDLGAIVGAMPVVPYALEVPNDAKRLELGAVEYARQVLQVTREFFDIIDAGEKAVTA
ncbi:MAG: sugar phosphate isomerase/epimerase [Acidimicrobiia bacterium]